MDFQLCQPGRVAADGEAIDAARWRFTEDIVATLEGPGDRR